MFIHRILLEDITIKICFNRINYEVEPSKKEIIRLVSLHLGPWRFVDQPIEYAYLTAKADAFNLQDDAFNTMRIY